MSDVYTIAEVVRRNIKLQHFYPAKLEAYNESRVLGFRYVCRRDPKITIAVFFYADRATVGIELGGPYFEYADPTFVDQLHKHIVERARTLVHS